MKRTAFTMVELIFVIVIIGILSAVALPKFSGIKDRAKINRELSAMNSFDGAITAAIEFQIDDFGNKDVNWHNEAINSGNNALITRVDLTEAYSEINKDKKVLSKIGKKIDTFVIQGAVSTNGTDIVVYSAAHSNPSNDILFLTSTASNPSTGVSKPTDIPGKPDSNDLWVFNPNSFDINITSTAGFPLAVSPTIIPSYSIALLDVNGTTQLTTGTNIRNLTVVRNDTSTASVASDVIEID